MLNFFLLLSFIISTNTFAQSLVSTKKSYIKLRDPEFSAKESFGNWKTVNSEFNQNLFLGAYPPGEFLSVTAAPEEGGCKKDQSFLFSVDQRQNLSKLSLPFSQLQCQEAEKIRETKELNPEACLMLANCYKSRATLSDGGYEVLVKAREKTAAEAVSLMSSTTISQLYDLEELKAYVIEKYDADFLPEDCREENALEVPPEENSVCMTKVIDNGFELSQKSCRLVDVGCSPDYLNFIKDKKTDNGKSSLMADFIRSKTKETAKVFAAEDLSVIQEIAHLMTKESETPEARTKAVMEFLTKNFTRLDPIYKNYIKQSIRNKEVGEKDEIQDGILKYIKANNSGRNPLEIVVELDTLRRKEAHKRLVESCQKVITVPKLCKIVKDVLNGAEVQVPKKNFEQMMKRQEFTKNSRMSKQEMADNVSRCNTFSIDTSLGKNGSAAIRLSNGLDLFSSGNEGLFAIKNAALNGITSIVNSQDMRAQIIVKADGEVSKKDRMSSGISERLNSTKEGKTSDTVLVTKFSNNQVMQDAKRPEVSLKGVSAVAVKGTDRAEITELKGQASKEEVTKVIKDSNSSVIQMQPHGQQQNGISSKGILPGGIRAQDTIVESQNGHVKNELAVRPQQQSADYNHLMNKITGLEEKLASQKKSAAEIVTTEPKIAEESDLVRELRMAKAALADIKTDVKTKAPAAAVVTEAARGARSSIDSDGRSEENDDLSIASSGSSKESRSAVSVTPSGNSSGSSSVSSSSGDRSPASVQESGGARGIGSGSAGDNSSSSIGDGMVLTRLDGISHSKASETISKMILAESGKPFFIEEGGLVKEIIPEVVDGVILKAEDGTPVYKTVVKGKVGEFKIDSKGKKIKKEVIAKAASPADVKIQDYQKVGSPVVRYKELQEIFNTKK